MAASPSSRNQRSHERDLTPLVGRQDQRDDQLDAPVPFVGVEEVVDGDLGQAVGLVPVGGPEVELRDQLGLDATELAGQELAVEGVVAIPLAPPVERHQELVGGLEVTEVDLRARPAEDGVAERARELVEDRGAAQEVLDVVGLPGQ